MFLLRSLSASNVPGEVSQPLFFLLRSLSASNVPGEVSVGLREPLISSQHLMSPPTLHGAKGMRALFARCHGDVSDWEKEK